MSDVMTDKAMTAPERMTMERCLTSNFLLKFGMDIFGKRDLLYIDMRGSTDVANMYSMDANIEPRKIPKPEKAAAADAGGDDAGDDAGDDE